MARGVTVVLLASAQKRCKDNWLSGEPAGIRTQDPMIKSHVLYQLSYGLWGLAKSGGTIVGCDRWSKAGKMGSPAAKAIV
jgi:hypothetical protein